MARQPSTEVTKEIHLELLLSNFGTFCHDLTDTVMGCCIHSPIPISPQQPDNNFTTQVPTRYAGSYLGKQCFDKIIVLFLILSYLLTRQAIPRLRNH